MFRKMPALLLTEILLIVLLHRWIPLEIKSFFYAISLFIKSLIIFFLPALIFGLIFKTTLHLIRKASKLLVFLVMAVVVSNFLSTLISYGIGSFVCQFHLSMPFPPQESTLQPLWEFSFVKWLRNDVAMLIGLCSGIVLGVWKPLRAMLVASYIERKIDQVLRPFLYVIPLFIAGFIMQMCHDQIIGHIVYRYGWILAIIGSAVFLYICLLYWLFSKAHGVSFLKSIKNMMPAAITGFGSMSSAAAMPLSIIGTEKNTRNSDLASAVIPATVNIHLIGDCFAIPVFALAILQSFGMPDPSFANYLVFAIYFVLAKFSVAAVPGGGILVMLPILEAYLGFDGTMLSLITALYILFDPVITCANVFGNGGFAMGTSWLFKGYAYHTCEK